MPKNNINIRNTHRETPNLYKEYDRLPFSVKESLRTIRTNILFSIPDSVSKCIGITSANRGDGKSTTLINIALSFAQINKKVIIIDCDLRLPKIHTCFALDNKVGLTNYLVGDEEKSEIIRKIDDNVSVITSGVIPNDPTFLLESDELHSLILSLKEEYDFVMVDLPPVNIVTDAAVMSRNLDFYLLVIRHNNSKGKDVENLLNLLSFSDTRILGYIYNDAEIETKKYRYSKYKTYGYQ